MTCPHGVTEKQRDEALTDQYDREKETGMREWGYLCSCCMAPSWEFLTCPTCSMGATSD